MGRDGRGACLIIPFSPSEKLERHRRGGGPEASSSLAGSPLVQEPDFMGPAVAAQLLGGFFLFHVVLDMDGLVDGRGPPSPPPTFAFPPFPPGPVSRNKQKGAGEGGPPEPELGLACRLESTN